MDSTKSSKPSTLPHHADWQQAHSPDLQPARPDLATVLLLAREHCVYCHGVYHRRAPGSPGCKHRACCFCLDSHPHALHCSLGVLVHRVNDPALELIVKQLTTKLLNPKKDADVQRETAAIGIKAVVQEVSSTGQAAVLVQHATGQLLSGVQREVVLASQAACLLFL